MEGVIEMSLKYKGFKNMSLSELFFQLGEWSGEYDRLKHIGENTTVAEEAIESITYFLKLKGWIVKDTSS